MSNFGSAKDEIRQAIDIVELVGSYLPLSRQGRNFVGLCPFHNDSKPSLQVNPERQIWKCWPCNKGGDIFSFVMEHDKVDFREALQLLADRAKIELKQYAPQKPVAPGSPDDKVALLQAAAWVEQQFHDYLLKADGAEVARHYLEDRGITPASVEKFRIGFCPDSFTWLLDKSRSTPHSPAILEAIDVIGKSERGSYYDRFRGRVMFPIRDAQSRPIAFGGRVMPGAKDQGGKYINSRETKLFSKREQLYALDIAAKEILKSKSGHLTVVEGYTDVVLCHQFGVNDVVACLGVALGEHHMPVLRRYANTVTLLLDGDAAGQASTNRILELFVTAGLDLRILTLPDELDPAEFMLERGAEPFRRLLRDEAVDALEHKIRVVTKDLDIARDTHRASVALEDILSTLARGAAAGGLDAKSLRSQQLLARLARQFLLNEEDVRKRFYELCSSSKVAPVATSQPATTVSQARPRPEYQVTAISMDEIELLEILVAHHDLACTALAELGELDLSADATKVIFRTYRQLEEAGESLEFNRVLAEVEDVHLKSLLVQLVEIADRKATKANLDPPTRLRHLLQKFHRGHEQRIIREKQSLLQQSEVGEQAKHDVFLEILEAKRRQQGIIAPTEG